MLWVIDVAVHSFFWNIFVNGLHRFFLVENIVDHLHGSEDLHVHKKRHPCFGVRCLKYPSKWQVCSNTQKKKRNLQPACTTTHPPTQPSPPPPVEVVYGLTMDPRSQLLNLSRRAALLGCSSFAWTIVPGWLTGSSKCHIGKWWKR